MTNRITQHQASLLCLSMLQCGNSLHDFVTLTARTRQ